MEYLAVDHMADQGRVTESFTCYFSYKRSGGIGVIRIVATFKIYAGAEGGRDWYYDHNSKLSSQ